MDAVDGGFGAFVLVARLHDASLEVFRAHRCLEVDVSGPLRLAIFREPPDVLPDPARALVKAARWAERCRHPGVVRVLEVGRLSGHLYAVSELADGVDLERLLGECAERGLTLPFEVTLGVGAQLAALARELHHTLEQDEPMLLEYLRPRDVVITWDGRVRVRHCGRRPDPRRGHDVFLAPDLALGAPATARTDAWVIGRLLRSLLSGEVEGRRGPRTGTGKSALVYDHLSAMLARDPAERPDALEIEARMTRLLDELGGGSPRAAAGAFLAQHLSHLRARGDIPTPLSPQALEEARRRAAAGPAPQLYYPGDAFLDDDPDEEPIRTIDRTDLVTRPSHTELRELIAQVRGERHPPVGLDEAEPDTRSGDPVLPADEGGLDLDVIASLYVEDEGPLGAHDTKTGPSPLGRFSPSDTVVTSLSGGAVKDALERNATDVVERPPGLVDAAVSDDEDIFASSGDFGVEVTSATADTAASAATRVSRRPRHQDLAALGPLDALPLADVERTYASPLPEGAMDLLSFEDEETPTRNVVPAPPPQLSPRSEPDSGNVFTEARSPLKPATQESPFATASERTEMLPSLDRLPSPPRGGDGTGVFESQPFSIDLDDDEPTVQIDREVAQRALQLALARASAAGATEEPLEKTSVLPGASDDPEGTALLGREPLRIDLDDVPSETGEIFASAARAVASGAPIEDEQLGVLVVEVPADAVVFVNGAEQGRGRVLIPDLNRYAQYQVRIHRRGHHPWTASVSLKGQPAARIEPELTPR